MVLFLFFRSSFFKKEKEGAFYVLMFFSADLLFEMKL